MMNRRDSALLLPLVIAACTPAASVDRTQTTGMANQAAEVSLPVLPAGTRISVQLDQPLGGATTAMSRTFTARVVEPVIARTGETLVPAGAVIESTVVDSKGALGPPMELIGVNPERIEIAGASFPLASRIIEVTLADAAPAPVTMSDVALLGTPQAMIPGTILGDATEILHENELGPNPGTVISLGGNGESALPKGARLTLEVVEEVPLYARIPQEAQPSSFAAARTVRY
jgi:hypothetical protein